MRRRSASCAKRVVGESKTSSIVLHSFTTYTRMQSKRQLFTSEGRCWHQSVSPTLVLARLGNATASLNLSVSPTRLRRYCCAVRRDERHCAATASRSGETQGDASPPPIRPTPAPTRLFANSCSSTYAD